MNKSCSQKLTIPQFKGTCWFNSLLTVLFFSEKMSKFMKKALNDNISKMMETNKTKRPSAVELKAATSKVKIIRMLLKVVNANENNNPDTLQEFYETLQPQQILAYLHKHEPATFYFDPDKVQGFSGEMYLAQLFRFLDISDKVMYVTQQGEKYYFDHANIYKYEGILINANPRIAGDYRNLESDSPRLQYLASRYATTENTSSQKMKNIEVVIIGKGLAFDRMDDKKTDEIPLFHNSDTNFSLPGLGDFSLDGLLLRNHNQNQCSKGHQIAGVTCEGKRYLYNGWMIDQQTTKSQSPNRNNIIDRPSKKACNLHEFDWFNKKSNFCITKETCNFPEGTQVNEMCFNVKSMNTHIYVKDVPETEAERWSRWSQNVEAEKSAEKFRKLDEAENARKAKAEKIAENSRRIDAANAKKAKAEKSIEKTRKDAAERVKAEYARKAAEETAKAEIARKAAKAKAENARKAAEETTKAENARKAAEETAKVEISRKAAEKSAEKFRKIDEAERVKSENARKVAGENKKKIAAENAKYNRDKKIASENARKVADETAKNGKKVESKQGNKTSCEKGKILNPVTDRCVSETGAIGKKLLAKDKDKDKAKPLKTTNKKKDCEKGKILNPATDRCVNENGAIGKTLL